MCHREGPVSCEDSSCLRSVSIGVGCAALRFVGHTVLCGKNLSAVGRICAM